MTQSTTSPVSLSTRNVLLLTRSYSASTMLALVGALAITGGCAKDTSKLTEGNGSHATGGKSSKGGNSSTDSGGTAGNNQAGGDVGGNAGSAAGGTPDGGGGSAPGSTDTSPGGSTSGGSSTNPVSAIVETVDVGLIYSGQPTDFSLNTVGNQQFIAYWDGESAADRYKYLTVASRVLGEKTWTKVTLSPKMSWDAHHGLALAADKKGYLHLSGRMHNEPLNYWRSAAPFDITTFAQHKNMYDVGDEMSCTYPKFFVGPIGDIVYSYRMGSSGDGYTIFNYFNASTKIWKRLLGTRLIDGSSSANSAYTVGPIEGPDGYWHMVWTWRSTAYAETNHDLSYAKTQDFQTWYKADGTKLVLPITLATADIVDAVPVGGGMINNNTKVGFDSQNRPVVVYHKYDANGYTQLYNARFENGVWVPHQTSSWKYAWNFSGLNTLIFEIEVDGVKSYSNGQLKQLYYHKQYGGWGGFVLNETTLAATETIAPPFPFPAEFAAVESTYADMHVRWTMDAGKGPDPDIYYVMRWETLDPNGDVERKPEPPSTMMRVYGIRRSLM